MKVTLDPENSKLVAAMVKVRLYPSADEAVNALLAHSRQIRKLSADEIGELRAEIDVGLAELDRGECAEFTGDDIKAEGRALLAERRRRRKGA